MVCKGPKGDNDIGKMGSNLEFSMRNPKYVLNAHKSCQRSPKDSANIFWTIGDLLEAQKSDFSQKNLFSKH